MIKKKLLAEANQFFFRLNGPQSIAVALVVSWIRANHHGQQPSGRERSKDGLHYADDGTAVSLVDLTDELEFRFCGRKGKRKL